MTLFQLPVIIEVGWMKADDQTILALHTRVITHNPRITVSHDDSLKTWQLRIRQLKESDRGCYMCQINTGEMKKQFGCIDVHEYISISSI
ncbi:zwei Ig domain protein zig-8-like [Anoplophora glabripennis]|uniref:zwei Ig domain protein zig-8-like n=1 Tax=Anoplophora glabripennis TaxID=217634 RepID=UPI000C7573A1|nr:zwei Ig domain protein zig-8-like [Anoplophora glabripennis]